MKDHKMRTTTILRNSFQMNLKLGVINVNGLPRTKYASIQCVVESEDLDLLFVQETHRQSNEFWPGPSIQGYTWLEVTREEGEKQGGGLGMLVNEDLPMSDWAGLEESTERMWLLYEQALIYCFNIHLVYFIFDIYVHLFI